MRERTVASLLATDWDEEPVIEIDQTTGSPKHERIVHAALQLLRRAVSDASEITIFLEDDLRFNQYLRYNLERWDPLVRVQPGHHFFGSLYNPGVGELDRDRDRGFFVADPRCVYGCQAFIFSLATAQHIIQFWDQVDGFQDFRMSRLASRICPIYYHIPSLVQHIGRPSTWGGHYHRAPDFQPDWKTRAS